MESFLIELLLLLDEVFYEPAVLVWCRCMLQAQFASIV